PLLLLGDGVLVGGNGLAAVAAPEERQVGRILVGESLGVDLVERLVDGGTQVVARALADSRHELGLRGGRIQTGGRGGAADGRRAGCRCNRGRLGLDARGRGCRCRRRVDG